jgi:hypothetical protein
VDAVTYIEGWDPGGTTGYVFGHFDDVRPFSIYRTANLSKEKVLSEISDWAPVERDEAPIRVVEGFRLRSSNRFTADLTGDRIIGAMELAEYVGWTDIIWQMPTDKAHVPDQVLRDGGLWRTKGEGGSRHIHDAIIHVLKYLKVDLKHEPTIRKYWP